LAREGMRGRDGGFWSGTGRKNHRLGPAPLTVAMSVGPHIDPTGASLRRRLHSSGTARRTTMVRVIAIALILFFTGAALADDW
jgi:hypothetical protein